MLDDVLQGIEFVLSIPNYNRDAPIRTLNINGRFNINSVLAILDTPSPSVMDYVGYGTQYLAKNQIPFLAMLPWSPSGLLLPSQT